MPADSVFIVLVAGLVMGALSYVWLRMKVGTDWWEYVVPAAGLRAVEWGLGEYLDVPGDFNHIAFYWALAVLAFIILWAWLGRPPE